MRDKIKKLVEVWLEFATIVFITIMLFASGAAMVAIIKRYIIDPWLS